MAQEFSKSSGMTGELGQEASKMRSDFEETVGKAKDAAQEKLHRIGETASEYYKQGLDKARDWENNFESFIKDRPITSVLIATGVGLFFGMLWSRR
jgi:ElaB/YqjD/DUF883 family membrane-anchored ribosome-binding protein